MVEINTIVPHNLGRVDALARMHQMVDSLGQRFPQQVHQVRSSWHDNTLNIRFAAYGYMVQWEAVVMEEQISLLGKIPDTAKVFKAKIEQTIVSRIETVLNDTSSQNMPSAVQRRKVA